MAEMKAVKITKVNYVSQKQRDLQKGKWFSIKEYLLYCSNQCVQLYYWELKSVYNKTLSSMVNCLLTYKNQVTLMVLPDSWHLKFQASLIPHKSRKHVLTYLVSDPLLKVKQNLRKVLWHWFAEAAAMMHLPGFPGFTKCPVTKEDHTIISFELVLKHEQKPFSFLSPHPNKGTNKQITRNTKIFQREDKQALVLMKLNPEPAHGFIILLRGMADLCLPEITCYWIS